MPHSDLHLPHTWKYFMHSELNQLNISLAIRGFAFSILSLFVPAYLHSELGYAVSEVLWFFVYFALVLAISSPFLVLISSKIGFKHMMILSMPLQLIYLFSLHLLSTHTFSLFYVALALGLGIASFNIGVHLEFQSISHAKSRGKEVGSRQAARLLGLLFGPLLGGGLIHYFGFIIVFCIVAVLVAISSLFLFMSKEHHGKLNVSWKRLGKAFDVKLALYYLYRGSWIIATGVLWPLFIFLQLGSYLALGVIGTLMSLITVFLDLDMGKKSDQIGKHKIVHFSAVPEAIVWIFRGFFASLGGIVGMSIFQSLTSSSLMAPLLAIEYNKAKKTGTVLEYYIWRQLFIGLGRALILGFTLIVGSFVASFAFVGLGTFFVFLL